MQKTSGDVAFVELLEAGAKGGISGCLNWLKSPHRKKWALSPAMGRTAGGDTDPVRQGKICRGFVQGIR